MTNLSVHFSSATDDWATPQQTFDWLNREYGPFDIDVCASAKNAKCENYFGLDNGTDGLRDPWRPYADLATMDPVRCFMNPPYGRTIGAWVRKAYEESQRGCLVVCLLPARTDTKWFHDYCTKGKIEFLRGRLKFGGAKNSAPFPSMVVVFQRPLGV